MNEIWTIFAFPLNLLVAALLGLCLVWLRNNYYACAVMRFLHSPVATISAISMLVLACVWIGLSGDRTFVESIVFVAVLLYVQIVLFLITLRGWRRPDGVIRWRFLCLHLGLLLAVGAGFWGSPDSDEYRIRLHTGETSREAFQIDGRRAVLSYDITLIDVDTEYADNGTASHYEAVISVARQKEVTLMVNRPYAVRLGEDLYLSSVSEDSCVLQIVKEPWRYFALAGIILMLAGAFMLFINGPRK
jgi:hypothetical protein